MRMISLLGEKAVVLTVAHLVGVPAEPVVGQTGETRKALHQLVGEERLPLSLVLCTPTQTHIRNINNTNISSQCFPMGGVEQS